MLMFLPNLFPNVQRPSAAKLLEGAKFDDYMRASVQEHFGKYEQCVQAN